jgi:hypothetical protein
MSLAQVYGHRPPNALDIWTWYFYDKRCTLVYGMSKTGLVLVFNELS